MQGILLDRQVSVWRRVMSGSGIQAAFTETQIFASVPAQIVPMSSFDAHVSWAYESTHVIWVPYWLTTLRKEDEIHDGPRLSEPQWTTPQPRRFTVNGRREFRLGIPQICYYAKELD